jgi:hypothetical protein
MNMNLSLPTSNATFRLVQASRRYLSSSTFSKNLRLPLPTEGLAIQRILFSDLTWPDISFQPSHLQLTDSTWSSMMMMDDPDTDLDRLRLQLMMYPEEEQAAAGGDGECTMVRVKVQKVWWKKRDAEDDSRRRFSDSVGIVPEGGSPRKVPPSVQLQRRFSESAVGNVPVKAPLQPKPM